jgi:hypothetical protein
MEDELGRTCNVWGKQEILKELLLENLKGRDNLEDTGFSESIVSA